MTDLQAVPWLTLETIQYRMISYAQNQEDVLLARAFRDRSEPGFYVDLGANHPVYHSVTKLFSHLGWRGINVEPNPSMHSLLVADRPRDINLNMGVGDVDSELIFYQFAQDRGWSSFDPTIAEHFRATGSEPNELRIPVRRLETILEQHVPAGTPIDFLKVDVEGFEPHVFRSVDLRRWTPRIIVVESNGSEDWEPAILASGYEFAVFDGVNRFYARADDRATLSALASPVNCMDQSIPFEHYRLIGEAAELGLGPASIGFVRRLRNLARRHPRLAGVARRVLRRTA